MDENIQKILDTFQVRSWVTPLKESHVAIIQDINQRFKTMFNNFMINHKFKIEAVAEERSSSSEDCTKLVTGGRETLWLLDWAVFKDSATELNLPTSQLNVWSSHQDHSIVP